MKKPIEEEGATAMKKRGRASSISASASDSGSSQSTVALRMSAWLGQMLAVSPSPSPVGFRPPSQSGPPLPTNLRDMYDARFEVLASPKWREQLLDRPAHKRGTATDVAEMVLKMEEGPLACMLAFKSGEGMMCYLVRESGVWVEADAKEHHVLHHSLIAFSELLDHHVITAARQLARSVKAAVVAGNEPPDALCAVEDHLRELVDLYQALRTPALSAGIVKRIITVRAAETDEAGVTADCLDAARGCLAFKDGIMDFAAGRLRRGTAAQTFYQTMTVGYAYEDVLVEAGGGDDLDSPGAYELAGMPRPVPGGVAHRAWAEYDAFMARIFSSTPEVRPYLIDLLASSALNQNRQVLVIHHNVKGANGKSSLFALIKRAFGALFVKCASSLLNCASSVSPSGPNEELVSVRGKRIVLFSEPSSRLKLSASFIKELSGGDEQSTRANYGKKQTFVFSGTAHILCNKIPEIDDMEGGMRRRLRCIPYGSTFVDDPAQADPAKHVYPKLQEAESRFGVWKSFLIREVMEAAAAREAARLRGQPLPDSPPPVVLEATKELIERESMFDAFKARLVHTGNSKDHVTLKACYEEYSAMCSAEKKDADKKSCFKQELLGHLGPMSKKSDRLDNYWRGWTMDAPTSALPESSCP